LLEGAWKVLSLHRPLGEAALIHILLAVLAISMAMLGSGSWSIDACLFGRKRFVIDRTRGARILPKMGKGAPPIEEVI
jgi:hypothetical protein